MPVPINCVNLKSSPSNKPQKIATTGIKYVVDTEKTGDEIASSFIYRTFAIAVPKSASITMYTIDSIISGFDVKLEN